YGGWGIVAGQLPVATGIALGLVRQERPQAVLCELGDGAVNMGAWHESLNLASLWNLPIVYLVVNNVYGMGTSVKRASAEPELFRRAHAHRMVGERIDGDDLEEVLAATSELMRTARERRRPAVLETLTYRYRGHSVADAGLSYRDRDEIKRHQEHDPIKRVRETLGERGITDEQLEQADERAAEQIADAVEFANASAEPPLDQLAYGMYAKGSDEQFERMKPGSPFGEQELVFGAGLGQ
ncbi:MAG: pyruvate dehydrogenase (acetyl-transferring) E1 component subunit alpha, partial [Solirubrobacterales bacterium]|nr:pyruvate dehydrogenase (acetyl-transferring) E1 component subunit alpha [Solirubrobacterales bacterium]